jgi:23S rRNA (uracil1939-C5)-methyltransferase
VVLKVRSGKVGFLQRESHRLVEIDRCLLLPEDGEKVITEIKRDPLTQNIMDGEIMILGNGGKYSALAKEGQSFQYLTPEKGITFDVGGFSYWFTPDNFIQANRFTLDVMVELVVKQIKTSPLSHAIDLYCGAGLFTIPLSQGSQKVTAIDNEPGNLRSLEKNLKVNGIENVTVIKSKINRASLPDADLVLADPPRTGLKADTIQKMSRGPARQIIYFSCDSATFCRDIARFRVYGYRPEGITIIDNFPQTDHFEIFCALGSAIH